MFSPNVDIALLTEYPHLAALWPITWHSCRVQRHVSRACSPQNLVPSTLREVQFKCIQSSDSRAIDRCVSNLLNNTVVLRSEQHIKYNELVAFPLEALCYSPSNRDL